MDMDLKKPLPLPTPTSRPYWDGLRQGRIRIQRCLDCDQWVFYPRSHCSHCLSPRLEWREVSGAATLYTFTIARQPTAPHFAADAPQIIAVVELSEGVRMTTTLADVDEASIRIGMPVAPVFDAVSDDVTMLRFRPAP